MQVFELGEPDSSVAAAFMEDEGPIAYVGDGL